MVTHTPKGHPAILLRIELVLLFAEKGRLILVRRMVTKVTVYGTS